MIWYGDTMIAENRHGKNAPGTWKLQVTFSEEEARLIKDWARRDKVNYADVIRAALASYRGL